MKRLCLTLIAGCAVLSHSLAAQKLAPAPEPPPEEETAPAAADAGEAQPVAADTATPANPVDDSAAEAAELAAVEETLAIESESLLSERQKKVRAKIAALFAHRDKPIPALTAPDNPFYRTVLTPPVIAAPAPDDTEASPVNSIPSDERVLAAVTANMRINGVLTVGQRRLIVINESPTAEGSVVPVKHLGGTVFVRVEEIAIGKVILSLGNARLPVAY